ncbi:MAG: hypothetical protein J7K98_01690 [Candidatus Aenigmarchaeota archaeon]|nr:hypothetical protein [Candidatus Aenigmarchaeota archaeon]
MDIEKIERLVEENRHNPEFLKRMYRTAEELYLKGRQELQPILQKIREYLSEYKKPEWEVEFLEKIRKHQEKELKRFIESPPIGTQAKEKSSKERPVMGIVDRYIQEIEKLTPLTGVVKDIIEYRLKEGKPIPVTLKYRLDRAIDVLELHLNALKKAKALLK